MRTGLLGGPCCNRLSSHWITGLTLPAWGGRGVSATPSLGIYYLELLSKAGNSREALSLGQTPNWLQCQAWWHMQPLVLH